MARILEQSAPDQVAGALSPHQGGAHRFALVVSKHKRRGRFLVGFRFAAPNSC